MGLFSSSLLFLWVLVLFTLSPSPSLSMQQQQLAHPSPSPPQRHLHRRSHQTLHILMTGPYHPADVPVVGVKKQRHEEENKKTTRNKRRRASGRSFGARQVSAMLPRGVVPPSGSSACHNYVPDSLDYYCGRSASAFHP